ncbi:SDR family NAD(P)-dependent oxidoreductase [Nocardioides sp. Bht2]|uniref:SDR family NAD(P)-dependent oxidoreductase n=1 Tax=Nocardioides sp. Bht2 TaxID=3392297 RepID=UPI0039B52DFD
MSEPMVRLDDKVALVTGAAVGQGAAEARLFVELGATVIATDIDGAGVAASAASIGAESYQLDTSSAADWQRVVDAVVADHGRVDVLVNNAGILRSGELADWAEETLRLVLDVNLLGPMLGMQTVAAVMPRGGSIVNVSSTAGVRGYPGALPYSASKWGLRGASRSAALDLAPQGIRVNCVCPGAVETPMVADRSSDFSHLPIPRRGSADEIARMVAFLASSASSYATGADFVVDGGATA